MLDRFSQDELFFLVAAFCIVLPLVFYFLEGVMGYFRRLDSAELKAFEGALAAESEEESPFTELSVEVRLARLERLCDGVQGAGVPQRRAAVEDGDGGAAEAPTGASTLSD
jgi:hypothetical protein